MKIFVISSLLFVSLFAVYIGEFGYIDGEIYVVRHGKMLKAFHGFKIDEYDTIHSKNFSHSSIIFNNNFIFNINGKKMIYVKKLMDENPVMRVKTEKSIHKKVLKDQDRNDYKYNSKFEKRRKKIEIEKKEERRLEEEKNLKYDYHVDKESEHIVNMPQNEKSNVEIGRVITNPNSKVRSVNIHIRAEGVSNSSRGHNSVSRAKMGVVNVK
jgi:hypothetical protein